MIGLKDEICVGAEPLSDGSRQRGGAGLGTARGGGGRGEQHRGGKINSATQLEQPFVDHPLEGGVDHRSVHRRCRQ